MGPTSSPSNPPTFLPTEDPTLQPTFDPTKSPTLPAKAQSKSSVMSDQLVVVLVSHMIITIFMSIAVCVLCCWVLPIVRRDARCKRVSEKPGSTTVDVETLKLDGVPITAGDDTHKGCTTSMELHEAKNHRSPATMELQDLESTM